ncbi:DUF4179 domain-containing protein [Gracilibacillus sp. S3-1-1]|uniref:DUF4179 domain-containing protein n=1 Tax=Gracilibacillus pellucidus TaxID=3095368 RepID=A0ACC6M0C4_9BACI|nr:DUF4179 domain-containing protein [Gracilibacillus sp. S3-1-1]MDX8044391.1 DUF4179 domain-containing protein [Gracilibacillus sp. S3-1-1]
MNKEIKHFQQKVEQITIPEQVLEETITNAMKHTPKKAHFPFKKSIASIMSAAILLASLIGSAHFSPVMASMLHQIPIVGSVLSYYDIGLNHIQPTSVGDTVTDNDISITVTDTYADYNRFVIGYTIDLSDKTEQEKAALQNDFCSTFKLTINNQVISNAQEDWHLEGDQLLGLITINEGLPESFTAELVFSEVLWTSGQWKFHLPVEQNNTIAVYQPDQTSENDDYQFTINEIRVTPSTIVVETALTTPLYNETLYDLAINHNDTQLELLEHTETKRLHLAPFDKDRIEATTSFAALEGLDELSIVPIIDQEQQSDLSLTIDLAPDNIIALEKERKAAYTEERIDFDTYVWKELKAEWSNYLEIDPARYQHASLTVFDHDFYSSFYQSLSKKETEYIDPTAFINKANEKEAYIIYKESDGTNHLYHIEENKKWEIVDHTTFNGKTIEELRRSYQHR